MKAVLNAEELLMFIFSIFLFAESNLAWWWFIALILLPDFSMIGYAFGNKTGAILYNFLHHKGLGIILIIIGYYWHINSIYITGVIIFGHSSLDRLFGYGLKYFTGFKYTHLGEIGK